MDGIDALPVDCNALQLIRIGLLRQIGTGIKHPVAELVDIVAHQYQVALGISIVALGGPMTIGIGQRDFHIEVLQIPRQIELAISPVIELQIPVQHASPVGQLFVGVLQSLLREVADKLTMTSGVAIDILQLIVVLLVAIGVHIAHFTGPPALAVSGQALLKGLHVSFLTRQDRYCLTRIIGVGVGYQTLVDGSHGNVTVPPVGILSVKVLSLGINAVTCLTLVDHTSVLPLQSLKGLVHTGPDQLQVINDGIGRVINRQVVLIDQLIATLRILDHPKPQGLGILTIEPEQQVGCGALGDGIAAAVLVVDLDIGGTCGSGPGLVDGSAHIIDGQQLALGLPSHDLGSGLLGQGRGEDAEVVVLRRCGSPIVEHIAPEHGGQSTRVHRAAGLVQQDLGQLCSSEILAGITLGLLRGVVEQLTRIGITLGLAGLLIHDGPGGCFSIKQMQDIVDSPDLVLCFHHAAGLSGNAIHIIQTDVQPLLEGLHGQGHLVVGVLDTTNHTLSTSHCLGPVTVDADHGLLHIHRGNSVILIGQNHAVDQYAIHQYGVHRRPDNHIDRAVISGRDGRYTSLGQVAGGDILAVGRRGIGDPDLVNKYTVVDTAGIAPVPGDNDGVGLGHIGHILRISAGFSDGNHYPGIAAVCGQRHTPTAAGIRRDAVDGNNSIRVGRLSIEVHRPGTGTCIQIVVVHIVPESGAVDALIQGVSGEGQVSCAILSGGEGLQRGGGISSGLVSQLHLDAVFALPVDNRRVDTNVVGIPTHRNLPDIVQVHPDQVVSHFQLAGIRGSGSDGIGLHACVATAHQPSSAHIFLGQNVHRDLFHIIRHGHIVIMDSAVEHTGKSTLANAQILQLGRQIVVRQPYHIDNGPHPGLRPVTVLIHTVGHHFDVVLIAHIQRDRQLTPAVQNGSQLGCHAGLTGHIVHIDAGDPQFGGMLGLSPEVEVIHFIGHHHIVVLDSPDKVGRQDPILLLVTVQGLIDPQPGDHGHGLAVIGVLLRGLLIAPVQDDGKVTLTTLGTGDKYLNGVIAHHQVTDQIGLTGDSLPTVDDQVVGAGPLISDLIAHIPRLSTHGVGQHLVALFAVTRLALLALIHRVVTGVSQQVHRAGLVGQIHIVEGALCVKDRVGGIGNGAVIHIHDCQRSSRIEAGQEAGDLIIPVGSVPPDDDPVLLLGDIPICVGAISLLLLGCDLHSEDQLSLAQRQVVNEVVPSVGLAVHGQLQRLLGILVAPDRIGGGALHSNRGALLFFGPQSGPEVDIVVFFKHIPVLACLTVKDLYRVAVGIGDHLAGIHGIAQEVVDQLTIPDGSHIAAGGVIHPDDVGGVAPDLFLGQLLALVVIPAFSLIDILAADIVVGVAVSGVSHIQLHLISPLMGDLLTIPVQIGGLIGHRDPVGPLMERDVVGLGQLVLFQEELTSHTADS